MGFFSKIFKKENKEEPVYPVEDIEIELLADWFLTHTRSRFKDLEKDLYISIQSAKKQSEEVKSCLKKLRDAELINKNVTEKEFQIMEGNRNSFLQQYGILLAQLDFPEKVNYRNSLEFVNKYKEALSTFTKATSRNTQILRHFFNNELTSLNRCMQIMNEDVERMDLQLNDEEKGVKYVDQTNERILSFLAKCKHRNELLGKIDEENVKLGNSKKMKSKFDNEVESIKSRKEYSDFENLNTQRDTILADMKQIEADLYHVFSQLDKPLRKYGRIATENEEILSDYIADSVSALMKDENMKIIEILNSLKKAITGGSIDMKESDKDKAIQRIDNLNEGFFKNFKFRYEDLRKSKKKIDDQVKNNGLLRQLDDFAYKIRHTEEQISRAEETIAELQEKIDKLGIERLKNDLEHELRISTQLEVKINIGGTEQ